MSFTAVYSLVGWLGSLFCLQSQKWLSLFPLLRSWSSFFASLLPCCSAMASLFTPITITLALLNRTTEMLSPNQSSFLKARGQGGFHLTRGSLGGETLVSLMAQPCMYAYTTHFLFYFSVHTLNGFLFCCGFC